jgi:UDP-GlcNAc:undecaprenyl-phosphate GlcNAc-1-phosphate transferase
MNIVGLSGAALAIAAFLCALGVTSTMVAITIQVCRKHHWVAKPRADRWHKGTPAMFGGVPLWLGFICACAIFLPRSNHFIWEIVGLSSLLFVLGLVDDLVHLRPGSKFLIQMLVAGLVLTCGVVYPLRDAWILNAAFSLIWIVGITNAFNLLDNMDGLSAGIALVVSVYLAMFYLSSGATQYAILLSVAAGAILGFLIFNFQPARIFMGDSGSLFVGFLLGSVSLLQTTHVVGVPNMVFTPIAVLAIPVFDTVFVSVTRRLRGQPVSVGGTDHSSHRLVNLGLRDRHAVLLLYFLSVISGSVALISRTLFYAHAIELVAFWWLFLLLFGIHLFREDGFGQRAFHHSKSPLMARLLSHDTLAFVLDPLVLSLSYYFAYFLRFRISVPHEDITLFLRSWPIVVATKFITLYFFRTYRFSWWRSSVGDAYRLARAVVVGEIAVVLLLTGLYRFVGFSRLVFVVDCLVSWILLVGLRKSFFLFKESVRICGDHGGSQRRVFVLGTSEHAELALRFLRDGQINCAGLIDTNGGSDLNRKVWGTQVVGRFDQLVELADRYGVSEIVLPQNESLPCSESDFHDLCRRDKLQLMKLGLHCANGHSASGTVLNIAPLRTPAARQPSLRGGRRSSS